MITEKNFYIELSSGKKLQFAKVKKEKVKTNKRKKFEDESGYTTGEAGSKERIEFYAQKIANGETLFER